MWLPCPPLPLHHSIRHSHVRSLIFFIRRLLLALTQRPVSHSPAHTHFHCDRNKMVFLKKFYRIMPEFKWYLIMGHFFHLGDSLDWYLLDPSGRNSLHMAAISDSRPGTCEKVVISNHSKLLKTTMNARYTYLKVHLRIKEPRVRFGTGRSDCRKGQSLLMTHDSSGAVGSECKPFCQAPHACRLDEITPQAPDRLMNYQFSC